MFVGAGVCPRINTQGLQRVAFWRMEWGTRKYSVDMYETDVGMRVFSLVQTCESWGGVVRVIE